MLEWASSFFMNPAVGLAGVAAVAVPVVIHLINRMRYRRVEFAAMQFLLASEEQNRRRILVEQMLLLLLRIALVLLAAFLIGRLVLSGGFAAFGGVSHRVIVIDDSLSMRAGGEDASAFRLAQQAVSRAVEEAAEAGDRRVTVLRGSAPREVQDVLAGQVVEQRFAPDMVAAVERFRPTFTQVDWQDVVAAVSERTEGEESPPSLTIYTDASAVDWAARPGTAAALADLAVSGVQIVRTGVAADGNLAVTGVDPTGATSAVGVPSRFRAAVRNFGDTDATDVTAAAALDGRDLPLSLRFGSIPAGETAFATFDVTFESPGPHAVSVRLPGDVLAEDDERFYAMTVAEEVGVLLVDGDPAGDGAQFVADALAADRAVTGFAPQVIGPQELARTRLDRFAGIYLVNVGDLPEDVLESLSDHVRGGGGLVWFLGPNTRPETLNSRGVPLGLFPIPLADAPQILNRTAGGPDVSAGDHPVFGILKGSENPFIDLVSVYQSFPPADGAELDGDAAESPKVIATLSNGTPLAVEKRLGDGRVVAVLTTAGPGPSDDRGRPTWNNWAGGPGAASFAIMILELQQYVTAGSDAGRRVRVGDPVPVKLPPGVAATASVTGPDGSVTRLQSKPASGSADGSTDSERAVAVFRGAETPGVYRVRVEGDGDGPESVFAANVSTSESDLTEATDEELAETLAGVRRAEILDADVAFASGAGTEGGPRLMLVALFLLLLCAEQLLAYRLSYHTR